MGGRVSFLEGKAQGLRTNEIILGGQRDPSQAQYGVIFGWIIHWVNDQPQKSFFPHASPFSTRHPMVVVFSPRIIFALLLQDRAQPCA